LPVKSTTIHLFTISGCFVFLAFSSINATLVQYSSPSDVKASVVCSTLYIFCKSFCISWRSSCVISPFLNCSSISCAFLRYSSANCSCSSFPISAIYLSTRDVVAFGSAFVFIFPLHSNVSLSTFV